MTTQGKYISTTERSLTSKGLSQSAAKVFPKGTILYAMYASLGECSIADVDLSTSQAILGISPSRSLDPDYLYFVLSGRKEQVRGLGQHGTQANLNKGIVQDFGIPLPPLPEQRAIAAALSDVDDLIAALDRLIEKKRAVKTAAMQRLLTGRQRLPGFSGAWETKRLGDLFSFKNGLNKGKRFFGQGTPIVNYMDVYSASELRAGDLQGRVTVDKREQENYAVERGDVFFTRTSETPEEIGIAAVMLDEPRETVFSGFVLRARPTSAELADSFKRYCFSTRAVRDQIESTSTYTTRALTNGRSLSSVVLHYPEWDEQVAIAAVLSDMDAEIAALEARRDKTKRIKQGMMQELLTGRTRLVGIPA